MRDLTFKRLETVEWWSHAYRIDAGDLMYCVRRINDPGSRRWVAFRVIREVHGWSETRTSLGVCRLLGQARTLCETDEREQGRK